MNQLLAPPYHGTSSSGIMLAVESMKRHSTNEGWLIAAGFEHAGYRLCGRRLSLDEVDVPKILEVTDPGIVVVQDKREWDVNPRDFRDRSARFHDVGVLADRPDIFKLTILKDAHQRPDYHAQSAAEIGCHAWIIYYHPDTVCETAAYVRPQHLIRTYHTLDVDTVPAYSAVGREGCLLSGAVSGVYPLRARLFKEADKLPQTTVLHHPGYHANGCDTPAYLQTLSRFKVAICTASVFRYALRKLIEATACGCIVITDLPKHERIPGIDDNLIRVHPAVTTGEVADLTRRLYSEYDPAKQADFAERAKMYFDYRAVGARLAYDIEALRQRYNS